MLPSMEFRKTRMEDGRLARPAPMKISLSPKTGMPANYPASTVGSAYPPKLIIFIVP